MTMQQAETALQDAEVVSAGEGPLLAARRTLEACLEAGIPAVLSRKEACGEANCESGGCGCGSHKQVQVLVREDDVPKVAALMHAEWQEVLKAEGVEWTPAAAAAEGEEPPCPACGTAAPLVDGACSDCGLQLE